MQKLFSISLVLSLWANQLIGDEIKLNCRWLETVSDEKFVVDDGVRHNFDKNERMYDDFLISINNQGCAPELGPRWGTVKFSEKWIECQFLNEKKNFQKSDTYFIELKNGSGLSKLIGSQETQLNTMTIVQ